MKYFSAGDGTDGMLLLAGSLGSCETMATLLAQAVPGRRILVPEYPAVNTVEECLCGIDQILQKEKVRNLAVYGASFGGLIAQCWVRRRPDMVTHLILSGAGFPEPSRARTNQRFVRLLPIIPERLIQVLLKIALHFMVRDTSVQGKVWRKEYGKLIARIRRPDVESRYRIAIDFDQNYRFMDSDLSQWPGKILILEGSADRVAGKKIREGLRRLYPQAKIHTFEEAGHSAMLTHTNEWLKIISEFVTVNQTAAT